MSLFPSGVIAAFGVQETNATSSNNIVLRTRIFGMNVNGSITQLPIVPGDVHSAMRDSNGFAALTQPLMVVGEDSGSYLAAFDVFGSFSRPLWNVTLSRGCGYPVASTIVGNGPLVMVAVNVCSGQAVYVVDTAKGIIVSTSNGTLSHIFSYRNGFIVVQRNLSQFDIFDPSDLNTRLRSYTYAVDSNIVQRQVNPSNGDSYAVTKDYYIIGTPGSSLFNTDTQLGK
jgi:hypothetical protein